MVVAVFVLCIALGSTIVSAARRIPAFVLALNLWALVAVLLVLYRLLPLFPYGAHVIRSLFRDVEPAFHLYHITLVVALLCLIGPAVILSGATLPLLFHRLRDQAADLGAVAGRLYSWNTAGSLFGAVLGGYLLLFWLDLDQVYRIALRFAGADPRHELRQQEDLSKQEMVDVKSRLNRMDVRSRQGPWTTTTLKLIGTNPGKLAAELAESIGMEKKPFKTNVRKLKELGLTESLKIGYRLSPRGKAVFKGLVHRS